MKAMEELGVTSIQCLPVRKTFQDKTKITIPKQTNVKEIILSADDLETKFIVEI